MAGRQDTRRRFEQWLKNPNCEANVISAVAGVDMAEVATSEGIDPSMGQSNLALRRGGTFERGLFEKDGAKLIGALQETGALPSNASGLVDLRLRLNSGPMKSLEAAASKTRELLATAAKEGPAGLYGKLPAVISSATLEIPGQPVMLPDGKLAIDALLLRPSTTGEKIELVVGEIKTYPYRGGYTDSAELATARGQAGIYLHALRLVVSELGLEDELECSGDGVLVLSKAGTNDPWVLPREDISFQDKRAERGFVRLREAAEAVAEFDPEEEGVDKVLEAPVDYRPECISFCDRAPGCRRAAEKRGDAAVLGEDAKRLLGEIPIERAIELMNGDKPENEKERELAARLTEGAAA